MKINTALTLALLLSLTSPAFAWSVRMVWDPNPEPNIIEYTVYRSSGGAAPVNIAVVPANEQWYIDPQLAPGSGPYDYYVTATNTSGLESPPSNTITASEPRVIPPSAPNIRVFVVVTP